MRSPMCYVECMSIPARPPADYAWLLDDVGRMVRPQPQWESLSQQHWPDYRDYGWLNVCPAEDRSHLRQQLAENCRGDASWRLTLRWTSGPQQPVEDRSIQLSPVVDPAGTRRWMALLTSETPATDDGERAQLPRNAYIRDAQIAAIRQLSKKLAHDLRNPLGVIRLSASLPRRHVDGTPAALECLAEIESDVRAADAVLIEVLEATSQSDLNFTQVNLLELLDDVTRRIDTSGRIEWVVNAAEPAMVWGDRDGLHRVLSDLLRNSYEAMKGQGVVTLLAHPAADHWRIEVRDFGPG